ncbi:hypothetical protein D3C81_1753580 [compost metagenome]
MLDQRRQDREFEIVAGRDIEFPLCQCGNEGFLLLQHALDLLERIAHRTDQRFAARRWYQPTLGADEQLVAHGIAQAPQGMAYRWLTQRQPLARARHAARFPQRHKEHQQVQVERLDIHFFACDES